MGYQRIYALIPAYQPDRTLADLVRDLDREGLRVIVVDDGSGPDYEALFAVCAERARVLRHGTNWGKGAALKTGLTWLRENVPGPYTVVTLDADGQHTASDTVKVAQAAEEDPTTLVLGSRRQGRGCPFRSRFGNGVTRLVYQAAAHTSVYDTQTGLRAFSSRLVSALLEVPGERYEYEMNVLLRMAEEGRPIREVPIETIYLEGNRSSHFDTLRDSWRIYRDILKFSASSLLGFTVDYLLFSLLASLTGWTLFANIAARFVSAGVNFSVNRRLVFKDKGPFWRSAAQYFALAAGILAANSVILYSLTALGLNPYFAKLLTELILFVCSFTVQKKVIFRKKAPGAEGSVVRYEEVLEA